MAIARTCAAALPDQPPGPPARSPGRSRSRCAGRSPPWRSGRPPARWSRTGSRTRARRSRSAPSGYRCRPRRTRRTAGSRHPEGGGAASPGLSWPHARDRRSRRRPGVLRAGEGTGSPAVPGRRRAAALASRSRGARGALAEGIRLAAEQGARLVCLQELTLSPLLRDRPDGPRPRGAEPEELPGGPTHAFAAAAGAPRHGIHVHASLYERADATAGSASTPRSSSRPTASSSRAPASSTSRSPPATTRTATSARPAGRRRASRSSRSATARFGLPDLLGPVVPRARARLLRSRGAEVLVYPTAIGSEPDHPDFDTQPLWEQVIVANGIANGTFMVAVNRIGDRAAADASTARRSSPTPTAACSSRRRATSPPCSSPTSTSTSAATGSSCSRSSRTRRPDAYALADARRDPRALATVAAADAARQAADHPRPDPVRRRSARPRCAPTPSATTACTPTALRDPKVIVEPLHRRRLASPRPSTRSRPTSPDPELHELPGVCAHFVIDQRRDDPPARPARPMCRHTVGPELDRDRHRARRAQRRPGARQPRASSRPRSARRAGSRAATASRPRT